MGGGAGGDTGTWEQLGLQVFLWHLVTPPPHPPSFPQPHVLSDSRGLAC